MCAQELADGRIDPNLVHTPFRETRGSHADSYEMLGKRSISPHSKPPRDLGCCASDFFLESIRHDATPPRREVVAPTLEDWLLSLVETMESGRLELA